MADSPTWKIFHALSDQFTTWLTGFVPGSNDVPEWADELAGRMRLLVGDAEDAIRYASRCDDDSNLRVVVFTQSAVVVGSVQDIDGQSASLDVSAIPRKSLCKIEAIRAERSMFRRDWDFRSGWPGDFGIELTYADGTLLRLPRPDASEHARAHLFKFLPDLLSDFD